MRSTAFAIAFAATLVLGNDVVSAWAQESPPPETVAHGPEPIGAGLLVAPTRVVFEGRTRSAELTLLNTGSEPATYRISFIHLRMTEDGAFEEIEVPGAGEAFAEELVRYSPRQVSLEPMVPQAVRIQLRKPADLEPGEYRSHLLFRAIPSPVEAGVGMEEIDHRTEAGLQIRLIPIYGVTIPVIIRHGESQLEVRLSDPVLRFPPEPAEGAILEVLIHRTGNRSAFGNLRATWIPMRGQARVVGEMKGVAVYTPNAVRRVQMPLDLSEGPESGRLEVTYVEPGSRREAERLAALELSYP